MPVPPPVSAFLGPIAELVAHHLLAPPPRPGLLASWMASKILRLLGSGGMELSCWRETAAPERRSRSKLIRPELATDSGMRHRFIKEAATCSACGTPALSKLARYRNSAKGLISSCLFQRGNLSARLASHKPLQAAETLDLALPLAEVCSSPTGAE